MNAAKIAGQRFGKLVALHTVESLNGARWLCVCDCGGFAVRNAGSLLMAERRGQRTACKKCADIRRDESFRRARAGRLKYYAATGNLWPHQWL